LATAALFDGQEAGVLPEQTCTVLIEERLELMPGDGTQDVVARLVQACHMAYGISAPVRDQQQRCGLNIVLQEWELLGDGGVAVVVATQGIAEERHGTLVVDDGKQTNVDHLGVGGDIAMGKVDRGEVSGRGQGWPWRVLGDRLGSLISAAKKQVGGVVVQTVQGQTKRARDVASNTAQDGVTFAKESVEGTTEAIIVELFRRDVPQHFGATLLGPGRDVDQGQGLTETGCQEQAEDLAVGILELRVGW
jgi:hypothetical protein